MHASEHLGSPALRVARAIEDESGLDRIVDQVVPKVRSRLDAWPGVAAVLHGRPLGHALHPLMTDIPMGAWISATLLDLTGGQQAHRSADKLIGWGVVAAVPTIVTGVADWARSDRPARRVGLVHAAANDAALVLYAGSWLLRRRGRRRAGVAASLAAGALLGVGGYLGGHLSTRLGAPPNELSGPPRAH